MNTNRVFVFAVGKKLEEFGGINFLREASYADLLAHAVNAIAELAERLGNYNSAVPPEEQFGEKADAALADWLEEQRVAISTTYDACPNHECEGHGFNAYEQVCYTCNYGSGLWCSPWRTELRFEFSKEKGGIDPRRTKFHLS